MSASEFARWIERAGGKCDAPRVLRYLAAWDVAAEKGWVSPAADPLYLRYDRVCGLGQQSTPHPWG